MKTKNSSVLMSAKAWSWISVVVFLLLVTSASAVLRPRYPEKPQPPFSGHVIGSVDENSIQKPAELTSAVL